MKKLVLLAFAASASLSISTAHAQDVTPDQLSTEQLQAIAEAQRTEGLQDCMNNHSQDASSLAECNAEVEVQYQNTIAGVQGGSVQMQGETTSVSTPVGTDIAGARYEDQGPEKKGWEESDLQ